MPKLAIQETLLPGDTLAQRLRIAADLGLSAVEVMAADLDARIDELDVALRHAGLSVSGVNMGRRDGWLLADRAQRDSAADALREALGCALDLGADYVTFVPQYGAGDLPDLTPFASPLDLQRELLVWLLRGASDLAETMDAALALLPVNRQETTFITRLDAAAHCRREAGDHPHITLAASTYHAALEEADWLAALAAHHSLISVMYLSDINGKLPGRGGLPFGMLGERLAALDYRGWLVLAPAGGDPDAADSGELRVCLEFLRRCRLH